MAKRHFRTDVNKFSKNLRTICDWSLSPRLSYCIKIFGFLSGVVVWSVTNVSWLFVSHHPLDHIQTLMMGHTSSPWTLVPDQTTTPGKNPKTSIQHLRTASKLYAPKWWHEASSIQSSTRHYTPPYNIQTSWRPGVPDFCIPVLEVQV